MLHLMLMVTIVCLNALIVSAFAPDSVRSSSPTFQRNSVSYLLRSDRSSSSLPWIFCHHRHLAPSKTAVCMGWGPEPIWSPAQVLSVQDACVSGKSVTVMVEVSQETAEAYSVPGQYVQIRPAAATDKPFFVDEGGEASSIPTTSTSTSSSSPIKPLFLAIASSPNPQVSQFEFLIKKTPDNGWLTSPLTSLPLPVEISQILGKGFSITENLDGFKYDFPTQNVLLFAAGSGIAPIKAALETTNNILQIAKPGQGGRTCRLYYGEQTPDDLCFVHKFSTWEANGIQVVPVISQLDETTNDDWQGRTGYVQNALEEDGVAIPRNSAALLCGMKGMVESVTAILTKAGVFAGRVLTNF